MNKPQRKRMWAFYCTVQYVHNYAMHVGNVVDREVEGGKVIRGAKGRGGRKGRVGEKERKRKERQRGDSKEGEVKGRRGGKREKRRKGMEEGRIVEIKKRREEAVSGGQGGEGRNKI